MSLGLQYPTKWSEFIGQHRVVAELKLAAQYSRKSKRKTPIKPMLFAHTEHGIGKTTLAALLAYEAGVRVFWLQDEVSLPAARRTIAQMREHDVLFIDEIHQSAKGADWLLPVLENGVLVTKFGIESIPRITIVAATTEPQKLSAALKSRFRKPQFTSYTVEEGAKIARLKAKIFFNVEEKPLPNRRNYFELAQAGNCNPRAITEMVELLCQLVVTDQIKRCGSGYDLRPLWEMSGISPDGLTELDRQYLVTMHTSFNGGPVGIDSMEARLRARKGALVDTETRLQDKGLVEMGGRGRQLTNPAGLARARELSQA